MIHFIPDSADVAYEETFDDAPGPYAEAIARLSSIRQALACVEHIAGSEHSDSLAEAKLAVGWPAASPAKQRAYDIRSGRTAAAAAAGLETLASLREIGGEPNAAAVARLKKELGDGVATVDQLFSL
jgi:hypothetical protein